MMEKLSVRILKLHRETYGGLSLGNLKPGEKRELTKEEVKKLLPLTQTFDEF